MSAAARYSEAQLHTLRALGLVPWVRRDGFVHLGEPVRDVAEPPAAPTWQAGPAPAALSAVAHWLTPQPLAGFARRGERRYEHGGEGARLLVLAEAALGDTDLLPMAAPEAALVDAMLRAIDLERADYATAVVHAHQTGAPDEAAPRVADAVRGRAGLLWLSHQAATSGGERFELEGVVAFRVPHPARLLARPLEKRQAWQTLKALRQHLASS